MLQLLKRFTKLTVMAVIACSLIAGNSIVPYAHAAAPAPYSADPLPTVQINGIVWAQTIAGNKVYATGKFTQARPAGVAIGGAGSVARSNLLAYDITTGQLDTSFNHSLTGTNAEGRAITASPDGKRLYVGGTFSAVDGVAQSNFVAFDLTTNQKLSGFNGVSSVVKTTAATNTRVYLGGAFTSVAGQSRIRAAAFESNGTLATNWAPSISSNNNSFQSVTAMVVTPAQGNLIIGGSFNRVNGLQYLSNVAVKLDTGAPVTPWASTSATFPIRDQVKLNAPSGSGTEISSLTTDGSQVFLTSWGFGSANLDGFFEGRASISPVNGSINWINDCHGDSYGAIPINGVLYSAGHPHTCSQMGLWDILPNSKRALAETTTGITGKNTRPKDYPRYSTFEGYGHTSQLNWYPVLNTGSVSGSSQAAWTVTGNSQYLSYGGEFTTANGNPQQGLVRYGARSVAPNKQGPTNFDTSINNIAVGTKNAAGNPMIIVTSDIHDIDDKTMTYRVYRDGGSTPIYTTTMDTTFWQPNRFYFYDTGTTSAARAYKVTASDAFGNTVSTARYAINDDNQALVYTGKWTFQQGLSLTRKALGNNIHYTQTNGDKMTTKFSSGYIAIYTEKSTTRGNMTFKLDNEAPVTISAYTAGATEPQVKIYERSGLAAGTHTLTITKSSGAYMVIDGFKIYP